MKTIINLIAILISLNISAQNRLSTCWDKQVKPLQESFLTFSYVEELNRLQHSFEPWQQTTYKGKGVVWSNKDNFLKHDTLTRGKRVYFSKTDFSKDNLLFLDYGDKDLYPITHELFLDETVKTLRYSPIQILHYFKEHKIAERSVVDNEFDMYQTAINQTAITLFIRKKDGLLGKVTTLNNDELFGDVLTTFTYTGYKKMEGVYYPTKIHIAKINGQVIDKVEVTNATLTLIKPVLFETPKGYQFVKKEVIKPQIKVEKYTENIYFLALAHTNDRVMIVEFADFLLVAEAPLNSENGELIIKEAKKIAPKKPIKYFVFGHYHPHYLGGVRPFVHKGAEIIASDITKDYVTYIINAPHTLSPDSLQLEPTPLKIKLVEDSLLISDGSFTMNIYFIGEKSEHTKGYLIYYFPSLHLLFQDDLVWIKEEGEIKKAGRRQAGLYNAIIDLKLEVETIVQSWPVNDHGVKTVISFKELKASVEQE